MSDDKIVDDTRSNNRGDADVELAGGAEKSLPVSTTADNVPYSVFTRSQKRLITLLIGLSMLFSPMSANIYFPCIPALEESYHASRQLINLTITSYVIVQGIAPALFGDLADMIGRRPVYLLTFMVYVSASLGLALQRDYAALLVLRTLQSFGCSATVAIGYGVIADVVPSSQRGSMLGPAMVATNLGPSLGPLLGGVLAARAGWRWVFWLLCIMGIAFLALLVLCFPETARSIVGNGSIAPKGWHRTLAACLRQGHNDGISSTHQDPLSSCRSHKGVMPNPFKSVELIFNKNTSLVLSLSAIYYTIYYCTQASLAGFFADIYGYNELQVGLCYLAIGFGVALGGYANGMCIIVSQSLQKTTALHRQRITLMLSWVFETQADSSTDATESPQSVKE
ncbi:MAG: hypothetical protein OHK93_006904 [Ramalina farinacea]|uniref:Major facilitator superfamily (MFS) profile domain-containing protein n=1 Tax=Ramalina farinacea TaxID=258253 RepID=A0AA43TTX7_9LECA|nr:hypothetical protein [Ramalina farinacea]